VPVAPDKPKEPSDTSAGNGVDPAMCINEDFADIIDELVDQAVKEGVLSEEVAQWIRTHPLGAVVEEAVDNGFLTEAQANWIYQYATEHGKCGGPAPAESPAQNTPPPGPGGKAN